MDLSTAVPLARGGTGEVLKATDEATGRPVAIKLLRHNDPDWLARFRREYRALQSLDHPGICPILEFTEYQDRPALVMPFIDGENLAEAARGLSLKEKVELFARVVDAVAVAHRAGIVHRDLKPANILVQRDGDRLQPVVVDWGLARRIEDRTVTLTGVAIGTPGYLSPEQAQGKKAVDPRSDVYSLGVIAFELLSGRLPLPGETVAQSLLRVVNEDAPPVRRFEPDVPVELERILTQCLERDPDMRYPSAVELGEDLRAFREHRPVTARTTGMAYRMRRLVSRYPRITALVGSLSLVIVMIAGIGLWREWQAETRALARALAASELATRAASFEADLRLIYSLPLHDASAEADRLYGRLEAFVRDEQEALPALSGSLALARALLAIGRHGEALSLLDGLQAGPIVSPERARLLGTAHAEAWLQAHRDALRIDDAQLREQFLQRARDRHVVPALGHLQDTGLEGDALSQGLLQLLADNTDLALGHFRQAAESMTWSAPALRYLAEAHLELGQRRVDGGDLSAADLEYQQAQAILGQGLEIARSHPVLHRLSCRTSQLRLGLKMGGLGDLDPEQERIETCDQALVAAPEENSIAAASAYLMLGRGRVNAGANSTPLFERAAEILERAPASADSAAAAALRGDLLVSRAIAQLQSGGEPPLAMFEQGIEQLRLAAQLQPGEPDHWITLSEAVFHSARGLQAAGEAVDATYREAAEHARRAMELSDGSVLATMKYGDYLSWAGYYRFVAGGDPAAELDEAIATLRRLEDRSEDYPRVNSALAFALWTAAIHRYWLGEDPRQLVAEADAAFARMLERQPRRASTRFNRCGNLFLGIRYLHDRGRSAAGEIAHYAAQVEKLAEIAGADYAQYPLAELLHARAREAAIRKEDPLPLAQSAREAYGVVVSTPIDRYDGLQSFAELMIDAHRWRAERDKADAALLLADLALVLEGRQEFPEHYFLILALGELAGLGRDYPGLSEAQRDELVGLAREASQAALAGSVVLRQRQANMAVETAQVVSE